MHIKPVNSQVVGGKCNRALSKGKRKINYPKIDLSKVKSKVDMHVSMPKKQRPTEERHSFSKGGKCSSKTGSRTNSSTSLASLPEDMSQNRRHIDKEHDKHEKDNKKNDGFQPSGCNGTACTKNGQLQDKIY